MSASTVLIAIGIVLCGIALIVGLYVLIGAIVAAVLFEYTIKRHKRHSTGHSAGLDVFDDTIRKGCAWADSMAFERVEITSRDGVRLRGRFLECPGSKKAVLMMHGYLADTIYEFSCGMRYFYEQGYSVLLPAQRAHDESDGRYIGFGALERYDVLEWSRFLSRRCGKDTKILLHGVSMGASSVLMASDLSLPENVVGIVSDCAFTSPEAIMSHVLHRDLRLYGFPILFFARSYIRRFAKYNALQSTEDSLSHCSVPVLFIHGSDDELVPISMTLDNYHACASDKRLMVVRGAGHGCAYFADTPAYIRAVEDFAALCGI